MGPTKLVPNLAHVDELLVIGARKRVAASAAVPGDKSISHRVVLLAALAEGTTEVSGLNRGTDVAASLAAVRSLGVAVDDVNPGRTRITGTAELSSPVAPIDCGNSGTTMRILTGMLAARCDATLVGDESLSRRPMERVARPLRDMGADVKTDSGHAPVTTQAFGELHGIEHVDERSSAQVQTAILLAGLRADGATVAATRLVARDHTQRMLRAMGADITMDGAAVSVRRSRLNALHAYVVPGDFSTAMFLFVAAAIADAQMTICGLGLNPTRTAALDVMRRMGVDVRVANESKRHGEPVGDVSVGGRPSRGYEIPPDIVPNIIDEIPVLSALATVAPSPFRVRGAAELRVKESDRIAATAELLRRFGARADETEDGIFVQGGRKMSAPDRAATGGDHRIGMTAAALASGLGQPIVVEDAACIATSAPGFQEMWRAAFG